MAGCQMVLHAPSCSMSILEIELLSLQLGLSEASLQAQILPSVATALWPRFLANDGLVMFCYRRTDMAL